MATMTKEERAWVAKVQRLLSNPPSDRLGFYVTGDQDVTIYDRTKQGEIDAHQDANQHAEFSNSVDYHDAYLGHLNFPEQVHSTAG